MSAVEHSPVNRAAAPTSGEGAAGLHLHPYEIAQVCHDANRMLQVLLDDPVSADWEDFGHAGRRGVVDGVMLALEGATPEQLHDAWVEARLRDGWRHGEQIDRISLRHPDLVPWGELPPAQRAKDALFHAIVGALR